MSCFFCERHGWFDEVVVWWKGRERKGRRGNGRNRRERRRRGRRRKRKKREQNGAVIDKDKRQRPEQSVMARAQTRLPPELVLCRK